MRGNINKQLASVVLLLLLLVAVSIPVMATEGGDNSSTPAEGYTNASDGTPTDAIDVPPVDAGVITDIPVDDSVSSNDDSQTVDDSLPDGADEKGDITPSVDEDLIYATAYGANCQAGTCNVKPACQESKPDTPTPWPCTDKAKDTGSCTKKTDCASKATGSTKTCAKSACTKAK
jgi:hypothetical protein